MHFKASLTIKSRSKVTSNSIPIGTSMLLPILSYKLGIEDNILGLLGCASKISGLVLMALSPSSWYMYVGK